MALEFAVLYAEVALARLRRAARRTDGAAGQAMVEYGIILAVVGMVVLLAATTLGTAVSGVFGRIVAKISGIG